MMRFIVRATAILLVAAVLGACGGGDDTAADQPPWCLPDVVLPGDADAVEAVLAALPDEIGGDQRDLGSRDGMIQVTYEEPLEATPSISALSVTALERAFPEAGDLRAFDYMEMIVEVSEEEVDMPGGVTGEVHEISMDPGADLVWVTGLTIENGAQAHGVLFADPDSDWAFEVLASTPALRVELVEAFCESAMS